MDDETVARMRTLSNAEPDAAAAESAPAAESTPAAGSDGVDPRAPLTLTDPIDGTPRRVAMAPVVVPGRPEEVADTGWVVVVAEQPVEEGDRPGTAQPAGGAALVH